MDANADEPRYLARVGYTEIRHLSVDKLECIDENEQQRQTAEAHRRASKELEATWAAARTAILDGLARLRSSGRLDRRIVSDLRALERGVERIDRHVGLGR